MVLTGKPSDQRALQLIKPYVDDFTEIEKEDICSHFDNDTYAEFVAYVEHCDNAKYSWLLEQIKVPLMACLKFTAPVEEYINYLMRGVRVKQYALSFVNSKKISQLVAEAYGVTKEEMLIVEEFCKQYDEEHFDYYMN